MLEVIRYKKRGQEKVLHMAVINTRGQFYLGFRLMHEIITKHLLDETGSYQDSSTKRLTFKMTNWRGGGGQKKVHFYASSYGKIEVHSIRKLSKVLYNETLVLHHKQRKLLLKRDWC